MNSLTHLRNIGVIAHIDAGKTTLSERILFYTDRIHRMGEVHEGAATMDFLPEEQDRGITIASACTRCQWRDATFNLIDTPGHVDFTIEVERSLRVLDGAVGVFCAVAGVEPQSETVWRQSEKFGIPKLAFINKMDRLGACFADTLEAMRVRLGTRPVAVTIPIGEGEEFEAVLDLLTMERLDFDPADQGRTIRRSPLSSEEAAMAAPWREKLVEAAAEQDDRLLEVWLAGEEPEPAVLLAALRRGCLARDMVPVYAGSALRNAGVQPLMDGVVAFLPSPLDSHVSATNPAGGEVLTLPCDPDAPLAALVFKVLLEGARPLALVRLYSGTLVEGMALRNVTRDQEERVSRIFYLHAGRRENAAQAPAGDIVAVQGLRQVRTGDTLAVRERPLLLENIESYTPVISIALEPCNTEEGKKLDELLARFAMEDPTLAVETDEASGQRLVSGMGELHLEVLLDRMRREGGLSPRSGNPQVVQQETVRGEGVGQGEFDRELGGQAHYGLVRVRVRSRARDAGNEIRMEVDQTNWPAILAQAAREGVEDALQCGPSGLPVRDVAVRIESLGEKRPASSPAGYRMAASQAVRAALEAARPVVLEPIMDVEINVPEAMVGPAVSLFSTKGGKVEEMAEQAGVRMVRGHAPMRSLFGFSTSLRSATQGRAGLVLRFARFDTV